MTTARGRHETPVFLQAGPDEAFGIVTEPPGEARGTAALIVMGGGFHTSVHVNRFAVSMARHLAERGYHAMRIDYHGLGESSGSLDRYRLDQPFVEEVRAAVRWFRDRGVERFVMVGSCIGGRTALQTAVETAGTEAVVLITTPLVDMKMGEGTPARKMISTSVWRYWARGFHPRVLRRFFPPHSFRKQARVAAAHVRVGARVAWRRLRAKLAGERSEGLEVNPRVVSDLETLVRRGVPALVVYGSGDPFRTPVDPGGSRRIAHVLGVAGPLIDVRTVEGERAYRYVAGQGAIVAMTGEWLARRTAALPVPQAR